MDRLTWDHWQGGSFADETAISQTDFDGHKVYCGDAITLLAAYERTGLAPAEIAAMQAAFDKTIKEGCAASSLPQVFIDRVQGGWPGAGRGGCRVKNVIFKRVLEMVNDQTVVIPALEMPDALSIYCPAIAQILHFDAQRTRLCIWFMSTPGTEKTSRLRIRLIETGKVYERLEQEEYLGTVVIDDRQLVLHAFVSEVGPCDGGID